MIAGRLSEVVTVLAFIAFVACGDMQSLRREKQIKTYWRLTRAGIELTERSKQKPLTEEMIEDVVRHHFEQGRDAWGTPIEIRSRTDTFGHVTSYVLVSYGSDRRADGDDARYFSLQPHDVTGSLHLDLIVRDGEPITLAGK